MRRWPTSVPTLSASSRPPTRPPASDGKVKLQLLLADRESGSSLPR